MTPRHTLVPLALIVLFFIPGLAGAQALSPAEDPDADGVPNFLCTPQPDFCSPQPEVCVTGPEVCTGEGESMVCTPGAEICTPQPDICTPMPPQCAPLSPPGGDNCSDIANPDQMDTDADQVGDACDQTPNGESILRVVVKVINDNGGVVTPEEITVHVTLAQPSEEMTTKSIFSRLARVFGIGTVRAADTLTAPADFPGNASGTDIVFGVGSTNYRVSSDVPQRYIVDNALCPDGSVPPNTIQLCTLSFDDNYSFGTAYGDYPVLPQYVYGCTDPLAKNYRSDNTRDDGSCHYATSTGSVLGASTDVPDLPLPPGCSPYLKAYLKQGRKNDPEEVKKLQTVLNEELGAQLPVTGFFGALTKRWVKMYQKKFEQEILKPWVDAGYGEGGGVAATGYAFITTRRHMNIAKCADLAKEPMPELRPDLNP